MKYIILFVSVIVTIGCTSEQPKSQNGHSTSAVHDHSAMHMKAGEPSAHSIYHASGTWQNRNREEIELGDLKGKIQIVAMLYTHCQYACPRILADMKRIQKNLSEEVREQTHFTVITIDPERDTPERFQVFGKEHDLPESNWSLLQGNESDTRELAALLGVKYKRISDKDFSHSNSITVLNQEGEIVHQQQTLGNQVESTVEMIKALAD